MAEVLARAEAAPDDFVLKPQREGGGNNLYGPELAARLHRREGLAAFILMQRIRPPVNTCAALSAALASCICRQRYDCTEFLWFGAPGLPRYKQ